MSDEIDRLFAAAARHPPPDFAARIVAQARGRPQIAAPPRLTILQAVSLAASAVCGAWLAAEFAFFAFIAAAAH